MTIKSSQDLVNNALKEAGDNLLGNMVTQVEDMIKLDR